jgi:hypothetical protein
VLNKSISADGNPKANVTVNHKRRGREQVTEVREGGIGNEQALCGSVRISRRDALDENLGLVIEGQASVLLQNLLDVREHLQRDGQLSFDVAIISVRYSAGVLVVLGEGPAPGGLFIERTSPQFITAVVSDLPVRIQNFVG